MWHLSLSLHGIVLFTTSGTIMALGVKERREGRWWGNKAMKGKEERLRQRMEHETGTFHLLSTIRYMKGDRDTLREWK